MSGASRDLPLFRQHLQFLADAPGGRSLLHPQELQHADRPHAAQELHLQVPGLHEAVQPVSETSSPRGEAPPPAGTGRTVSKPGFHPPVSLPVPVFSGHSLGGLVGDLVQSEIRGSACGGEISDIGQCRRDQTLLKLLTLQNTSSFIPKSEKPASGLGPCRLQPCVVGVCCVSTHRFVVPTTATTRHSFTTNSEKVLEDVVGSPPAGLHWLHKAVQLVPDGSAGA